MSMGTHTSGGGAIATKVDPRSAQSANSCANFYNQKVASSSNHLKSAHETVASSSKQSTRITISRVNGIVAARPVYTATAEDLERVKKSFTSPAKQHRKLEKPNSSAAYQVPHLVTSPRVSPLSNSISPITKRIKLEQKPHPTPKPKALAVPASKKPPLHPNCRKLCHFDTIKPSNLKFSPKNAILAVSGAHGPIEFHKLGNDLLALEENRVDRVRQKLRGHLLGVCDISWSPEDRYLASASDDSMLRLWDVETSCLLKIMKGHRKPVFSCALNPQGNIILSGSQDCTYRLWDIRTGMCFQTFEAHRSTITSVDFTKEDGSCFLSASYDGSCRIYDLLLGKCLRTIQHPLGCINPPVGHAKFSPNGRYLLTSYLSSQSAVKLWDFTDTSAKCLASYGDVDNRTLHTSYATPCDFVQWQGKSQWIISGCEKGNIAWWDIKSRDLVQEQLIEEYYSMPKQPRVVVGLDKHPTLPIIASCVREEERFTLFKYGPECS